jgi:hypothetical protein
MLRPALLGVSTALLMLPAAKAAAATPPGFYGVTPVDLPTQADLNQMDKANVGTIRVLFNWGEVQPTPGGPFDFSRLDAVVGGAAERGIRVLPFYFGTPAWARDCSGIPAGYCDRVDPTRTAVGADAWAAFLKAVVNRYGPGGSFWQATLLPPYTPPPYLPIAQHQIWNEENSSTFFRPRPDPAAYYRLLSVSSRAIRGADPNARIILGGLFFSPPNGQRLPQFLSRLYRFAGVRDLFDDIAIHPYSPDLDGIKFQLEEARKLLRKRDKSARVMLTEIGWGSERAGKKKTSLSKGVKGQKSLLRSSFRFLTARRARYKIDGIYWFSWRDVPSSAAGACLLCASFGLLTTSGATKPSYGAFVRFTGGS